MNKATLARIRDRRESVHGTRNIVEDMIAYCQTLGVPATEMERLAGGHVPDEVHAAADQEQSAS